MTAEQVRTLVDRRRLPFEPAGARLVETHASWVILTPEFVYKIKKPVHFSFLDFSTPEKRKFYCGEELRLNKRLAPDMYLDVLPVALDTDGMPHIALEAEAPIDYAVRMKRMDETRQMDLLLTAGQVTVQDMEALARQLARFHQDHILHDHVPYHAADNRSDFDDLFTLIPVVEKHFGAEAAQRLAALQAPVDRFLERHEPRLRERAAEGFWVDGHGDLHARNIFLLPEGPVIFDCIEFNEHFRRLDVLNELGFLCMDLEVNGHAELADAFMAAYLQAWPCIRNEEDRALFRYFKAYRANVRLKVGLLAMEGGGKGEAMRYLKWLGKWQL